MAHNWLTNQALRTAVTCLAPASRVMAPSSNELITSSGHRTQPRFILDFGSEEGRTAAHQWYERQGPNTRFSCLEYRKCREGPFKHEFIVVRLDQTTLCRFDRRARDGLRGHALKDEGTATEDSAHVMCALETEYKELIEKSEVLLSISFPDGEDLKLILAVCFGMQNHPRAASYSLLRYNCYFFAWTIVTAVARRALKWEGVVTSGVVWDAIRKSANGRIHTHSVPDRSTLARIGNWFTSLAARRASLFPDEEGIMYSWQVIESHFTNEAEFWDIDRILRQLSIRSQLVPTLTKEARRFVKAIRPYAMCSHVAGGIQKIVLKEFNHDTARSPKRLLASLYGFMLLEAWTLAESICHTAAEIMIKCQRSDEISDESECSGDSSGFSLDGDAWACAGRSHYPELLSLKGDHLHHVINSSGYQPQLYYATSEQFGADIKKIFDQIPQKTKEKYAELALEHCTLVAENVAAKLLEVLVDIDPKRLTFGKGAKRAWLTRNKRDMKWGIGTPSDPPLQEYIRCRMQDHFEMVNRFGFGTFEELITTAEASMCEIWVAALDVVDRDISSWTMNPLGK